MRKVIIITCLVLSGLIILDSMNAGHFLIMFLLAGLIPGTDIAISAVHMMEFFGLLIGIVIGRISGRALRPLFARIPQLSRA